jgi:hypothetical protein
VPRGSEASLIERSSHPRTSGSSAHNPTWWVSVATDGQSEPTMNLGPRGAAAAQGLGERSRRDPPETAEGRDSNPRGT